MNADEGVSLFKMVVTVLLVVLVVGAIVGLSYAAYSWFNSGTSKLTDQVASIDKSAFSQYDDTQISGVDVLSALKTYRESEIAIFILNKNNMASGAKPLELVNGSSDLTPYNYCALVSGFTAVTDSKGPGNTAVLKKADSGSISGCWVVQDGLDWDATTGVLTRNTNFSPTTTKSNTKTYVNQSAQWYCKLVYDATTNDICGILFVQMN